MVSPEIPVNEKERLEALEEYSVVDTLPEKDFDDITLLASEICHTPISTITFIDKQRQWFKSKVGLTGTETSREYAFCAHAINRPNEMLIVPDSRDDNRFFDNPLVTGDPHVIFYAGVPLTTPDGMTLGTLCIIDNTPRTLDKTQLASLKALGNVVVNQLELRKSNILLERNKLHLQRVNEELQQFSYVVSHDIRSPLNNIIAFTQMLDQEYSRQLDDSGVEIISYLNRSALKLKAFIEGILTHYKGDSLAANEKENVDLNSLLKNLTDILDGKHEFEFTFPDVSATIHINKAAVEQIFMNLITNAIKYNDKPKGKIGISFTEEKDHYIFSVADNGVGIDQKNFDKIFKVFETLGQKDRFQNDGTGIGLSTVKKLVEKLQGELSLKSTIGEGSVFTFTLQK